MMAIVDPFDQAVRWSVLIDTVSTGSTGDSWLDPSGQVTKWSTDTVSTSAPLVDTYRLSNGTGAVEAGGNSVAKVVRTISAREELGLPEDGCIVCAAETTSLFCPMCIQAIREARDRVVIEMIEEIRNGGAAVAKYHVGFVGDQNSTPLERRKAHAVEYVNGDYVQRAICGVEIGYTKRVTFGKDWSVTRPTCGNCVRVFNSRQ